MKDSRSRDEELGFMPKAVIMIYLDFRLSEGRLIKRQFQYCGLELMVV